MENSVINVHLRIEKEKGFVPWGAVLSGLLYYSIVSFCAECGFFYDEVGGCCVVSFHGLDHGFVCWIFLHFNEKGYSLRASAGKVEGTGLLTPTNISPAYMIH